MLKVKRGAVSCIGDFELKLIRLHGVNTRALSWHQDAADRDFQQKSSSLFDFYWIGLPSGVTNGKSIPRLRHL